MTDTKSELSQLKTWTTVVADTGDIDEIARVRPTEATTNPSLILKAAMTPRGEAVLREARRAPESASDRIDRVLTAFGAEILQHIPGRVSTEVDARLSFNTRATVEKARRIIALYEALGISRERILIKIACTWEGTQAARVLELEGIHCNMTLIFDLPQTIAASQARATLETAMAGVNDPGVQSVTRIWKALKASGSKTQVMGASFRNKGEITALAGCDLLTIAPKFIDELNTTFAPLPRVLDAEKLKSVEPLTISECDFRYALNASPLASGKLAQGIRSFAADTEKLEGLLH